MKGLLKKKPRRTNSAAKGCKNKTRKPTKKQSCKKSPTKKKTPTKKTQTKKKVPPKKSTPKKTPTEDTGIKVTIKTHKDKNGGHPHIIMDNLEDKHVSVGLSTDPTKGKGSKNYRLEKSPLNDGKHSYMRRQGTVAPKREYHSKRDGTVTVKDYERAKMYGDKAKQKYLNDKTNKKK